MVDGISGISAGTSIETIKEIVQEAVEEALEARDAGNAAGAEPISRRRINACR